jgi:hypothetical protein
MMAVRLIAPLPTGRHARFSRMDEIRTALRGLTGAVRGLSALVLVVAAGAACLGLVLGFVLAGVLL